MRAVKRSEAGRLLDDGGYLTSTERAVYSILLEKADNGDCSIPARFTPKVRELARRSGVTERTVRRVLVHLDHHGWVSYVHGQGRGRKGAYQVAPRQPDSRCTCSKRGRTRRLSDEKRGHSAPEKGDIWCRVVAGQGAVSTEGRGGGRDEGPLVRAADEEHRDGADETDQDATVTPIRRVYPSTWCTAADRLWAEGYDR